MVLEPVTSYFCSSYKGRAVKVKQSSVRFMEWCSKGEFSSAAGMSLSSCCFSSWRAPQDRIPQLSHLWVRIFWVDFPFFIAAVQFCVSSVCHYLFSFGSWSCNFLSFYFLLWNLFICLLPKIKIPEIDPVFFRRGFQPVWTYMGL